MELFGFEISRSKSKTEKSFVPPHDDGSLESIRAGGYYGTYFDIEGTANSETQLIKACNGIPISDKIFTKTQYLSDMALE